MLKESVRRELSIYGDLLVREYARNLQSDKTFATGKLANSLNFSIEELSNGVSLYIEGYSYGRVVDEGRSPSLPPPYKEIIKWINAKGSFRLRDSKGKFVPKTVKNVARAAYGVAQGIGVNGTIARFNYGGSNFLTMVYNRIANDMGDDFAEAFGEDVELELEKILYKK